MSADQQDYGQTAPAPPDPAASLTALSWCLRALACGYGLLAAERTAAIALLAAGIPGTNAADLAAAVKFLQAPRRVSGRRRGQASQLSIRFAERAEALRESDR